MIPQQLHRESGPYGSLLVATCPPESHLLDYQLELLMRHKPVWLLSTYIRYRNGSAQICLDTTGLRALDESLPAPGREPARGYKILGDIVRLLLDSADLLLAQDQFSLHPSLIYLDQEDELRLTFWPCRAEEMSPDQLPELCAGLGSAFGWPQADILAAGTAAQKGLAELSDWLARTGQEPAEAAAAAPPQKNKGAGPKTLTRVGQKLLLLAGLVSHAAFAVWTGLVISSSIWQNSRPFLLPALFCLAGLDLVFCLAGSRQGQPAKTRLALINLWQKLAGRLFAEKNADEQDQTVLLAKNDEFRLAMLSEGQPGTPAEHEGVRAFILVDEFLIGRDAQKTDLCLPQQAVGRLHARIERRAGSFFIRDLGSGNGTELDGQRLARHEDHLLPDSCLLSFAGREFHFTAD